jgi:crossover junction endodeoxyribonuclease RuvC
MKYLYARWHETRLFLIDLETDMRIIGIDPGYAIVGYGIIEYRSNRFTTLGYGAVTTAANMAFEKRIEQIYNELEELLVKYRPDAMAVEKLFFTSNQKTAIDVAQARGVILLAATKYGIPCFEYTPLQVKQSVVGYGKAIKSQVMEMTKRLLNLSAVPKPDDTADALAIAICHAHSAPSLLTMQRMNQLLKK